MMRKAIFLFLTAALGMVALNVWAAEVDSLTGTVSEDSLSLLGPANGTTCTLTVPAVVTNGQTFTATVSYFPPAPAGDREEKFEFNWPQGTISPTCDEFGEKTVRWKQWYPSPGGIGASFEYVVVPFALCVEGTFEARVKVKGTVHCNVTATMTVVNP